MFVDQAEIRVQSGAGGNGCLAFRREKFEPRGGPSGGDGGRGGDVILESSERHNTLVHFRFRPEHRAGRGRHGEGSQRHGRDGADVILKVPVGTVVYDADSGELVADFARANQSVVVAAGGRGGRGNAHFKSSTNRAPRRVEPGQPGQTRRLRLELKLLADVGLVGFPNVGKSTLISRLSAARPKIADYPFTTLQPNLGVLALPDERSCVVADIPGLIAGAHLGHGLGVQFLRHIERTRLLLQLVDLSPASGRTVSEEVATIDEELRAFGHGLEEKPRLLVGAKMDVAAPEKTRALRALARRRRRPLFLISAATGEGLPALTRGLDQALSELAAESAS